MKCPKCRFVSFDYLDNCKRCGSELFDLKKKLNILSIIPRTSGTDEFLTKLEADVPETQEMIDTMDSYIQPAVEDLGKEPITEEIDHEIEGQEEMVLEGLEEEIAGKEEADAEIVLPEISVGDENLEGRLKLELEKPIALPELTLGEGLDDEFVEKEDAGREIELSGISTGDEISIGIDNEEIMETIRIEEDVELFPLEIESSIEEFSSPEQSGENVEVIHLDLSNIEVIEVDEEEPLSDKESER